MASSRTRPLTPLVGKFSTPLFRLLVSGRYAHASVLNEFGKGFPQSKAGSSKIKMPRPYRTDLRWRIVWQHLVYRRPPSEIAQLMCVSERSVWRYISLFERTGDVKPANYHHGPCMLLGDFEQLTLLRLILQCPGIMLHELQDKFVRRFGVRVSVSTFCRTLKYMGCSRQVIRHVATQRSDSLRAKFMAEVCKYDPSMFVWTDESGFNKRNSARKFGYGMRGIPPVDHRILVRGVRYSAIPVVSTEGVHDVFIAEGTMNGNRFKQFVEDCVLPVLLPFDGNNPRSIVVMDNAAIHHVEEVIDLIETQAQAKVIFLPPYSPDLNPVETVFSKVKCIMKSNDAIFQVYSAPTLLFRNP